jgi:hypothetical protein
MANYSEFIAIGKLKTRIIWQVIFNTRLVKKFLIFTWQFFMIEVKLTSL